MQDFKEKFMNSRCDTFEESGHYVRVEEADTYAEVVKRFIQLHINKLHRKKSI
ncbi:hypothetical protein D3C86_2174090 [compost metagenome]